ncbi:MAG: glutamate racemase [Agarilytica sp.]
MIKAPKILIFDSGAGGLSIAIEVIKTCPGAHFVYAADHAYFPYGIKQDAELTARIVSQVESLYKKIQPDLVVVACNTASTLALETLRTEFPCPFVGVVPAIKPAAKLTQTGVIGVLATPATVNRAYTHNLIEDFAPKQKIVMHGSDTLVTLAEDKINKGEINEGQLNQELRTLFDKEHGEEIDTVVLACTHFPLLKPELISWARGENKNVNWIDSGKAIADRVQTLLGGKPNMRSSKKKNLTLEFQLISSANAALFEHHIKTHCRT